MSGYDWTVDESIAAVDAGEARAARKHTEAGFQNWMASVDAEVERRAGLSVEDLSDCCFLDWFLAGRTARAAAGRALKEARG